MKKIIFLLLSISAILYSCASDNTTQQAENAATSSTSNTSETPTGTQSGNTTESGIPSGPHDQLVRLSRIYLQYKNNGKASTDKVNEALARVEDPELDFVKQFVFASTQQSNDLLSNTFMKKPSVEDLKFIYQLRRVNWNSMSLTGVTAAVLDTFDMNTVSNEELVTAYYRLIMDGLQLSRNPKGDFADANLELDKLGLETNKEKAIAFYTIADAFSRKYNREMRNNLSDCEMAKSKVAIFPKFNGKALLNATPPTFDDFSVMIGNGAEGKSFKSFFLRNFDRAAAHYKACK